MPISSDEFLAAISASGIEIASWNDDSSPILGLERPIVPAPALNGWKWDVGSDVKTFIHDIRIASFVNHLIRSATDVIGLRIGAYDVSPGGNRSGIRYLMNDTLIEAAGRDLMLAFMPKGSLMQGIGYGERSVSLFVSLDWLERTIGREDELFKLVTAREQGLLCHYPRVSSRVDRITAELSAAVLDEGPTRGLLLRAKALELLAAAFDMVIHSDPAAKLTLRYRHNQRVREGVERVAGRIRQHPNQPLIAEDLVKIAGLNRTTLREGFKFITGETMLDFRTRIRMEQADRWLQQTRLSIREIARRLGFADSPSFINAYKQFFGRTPGEYRHVALLPRSRSIR